MNISSGLNTVSSLYGQQKGNQMKTPASGEKTFYTAETPKVYQIFTTDNMLWTGGNGTGLSYCLKYADDSTDENPVVLAKGVGLGFKNEFDMVHKRHYQLPDYPRQFALKEITGEDLSKDE